MLSLCSVCNEQSDIKLSKETEQPICGSCGKEPKLSIFTIKAMRRQKDFWSSKKQAYTFLCQACDKPTAAKLSDTNEVICSECNKLYDRMTNIMRQTVKNSLQQE